MKDGVDAGNIEASVGSDEQAIALREDFADLVLRVNMDLTTLRFTPTDPVSVEMAMAQMERSVDYHLQAFGDNTTLQALAPELKLRFRQGIQAQVPRSA